MVRKCIYGLCSSDSRYSHKPEMEGVRFHTVPNRRAFDNRKKLWLEASGRVDLLEKISETCSKKRLHICSKHFLGGNGPTEGHPNPVPCNFLVSIVNNRKRKLPDQAFSELATKLSFQKCPAIESSSTAAPSVDYTSETESAPESINSGTLECLAKPEPTVTVHPVNSSSTFTSDESKIKLKKLGTSAKVNSSSGESFRSVRDINPLSLILPRKWVCTVSDCLMFLKLSVFDSVLLKLKVDSQLKISLEVLGELLPKDHVIYSSFPAKITDHECLQQLLKKFSGWTPCEGNSDQRFLQLHQENGEKPGVFKRQTFGIHSKNCTMLTHHKIRCKPCQKVRANLRKVQSRLRIFFDTSELDMKNSRKKKGKCGKNSPPESSSCDDNSEKTSVASCTKDEDKNMINDFEMDEESAYYFVTVEYEDEDSTTREDTSST